MHSAGSGSPGEPELDLTGMTVADMRGLAYTLGIEIKSKKKADIAEEITAKYTNMQTEV